MAKDSYLSTAEPLKMARGIGVSSMIRDFAEETETAFDLIDELEGGKESVKKRVCISNRKLQPEPVIEPAKARSPGRSHVFHDIESFTMYVLKNKTDASVVLADSTKREATFVIDEGAANGFETVTYRPTFHPIMAKWMDGPWTASAFSQFILENRRCIVDGGMDESGKDLVGARDIVMAFRQIRTSKNVTVESGNGVKSINGVMIEVSIGSSSGKKPHEIVVELPDVVRIKTPIFVSSPEVTELDFDLFVYNDPQSRVMVSATNADLDSQVSAEFVSQVQEMRGSLDGEVLVGFGGYETKDWPTVGTGC